MRLFNKLTLFFTTLLLVSSCSEKQFDREPLLKIDKETLTFSSVAGVESVAVDMNKGDELHYIVNSASGTDWINVTTTSGGFDVSVQENNTLETRKATIKVLLLKGSHSSSVSVSQVAGGEIYINVSKENLDFTYEENEATLFIDANTDWTFSIDPVNPDWLIIDDSQKDKNTLIIKATENTANKKRVVKVKFIGSDVERVVTITQKGTMYFDFPFMNIGYLYEGAESERGMLYPNSLRDANGFELERGSTYLRNRSGILYDFGTKSPVFPMVSYEIYNMADRYVYSVRQIWIESTIPPLELPDNADFMEYLKEEGFEFAWKNAARYSSVYWNKERKISLFLTGSEYEFGAAMIFLHSNNRPNDPDNQVDKFKTFDALPPFYSEWGATAAQIRVWEEARGSKFLPGDSYGDIMLAFAPDPTVDPDIIERVYTLDQNTSPTQLLYTTLLIRDVEKVFYNGGFVPDYNAFTVTREFKTLMTDNGYNDEGHLPFSRIYNFSHKTKGFAFTAAIQEFAAEGYIPRLCLQVGPLEQPSGVKIK